MDSRMYRLGAVLASIFLLVGALVAASVVPIHPPGNLAVSPGEPVRGLATSGLNFDYVLTIIMENHNICDIYTHCGGTATYMTALADAYSISLQDNYCNVNPSLPNYLCLTGGTDFGCSGYDGGPNSNPCTNSAWSSVNIIDRILGAGLTFKAYMEDMPSNCYGSDSGGYAVRHDPFVYYNDIVSNSTRCNQVVPSGTAGSALLADLASTSTASNYMWLTPNECNDMHDCDIPTGDNYLSVLVPLILGSNVFLTQRAALLITFDEGYGQPIYTVWAGPVVKTAYTSSTAYSHFSVLSTIESNWNLPPLTSNDQNAPNMNEFFTTPAGPNFSLSANPTTVSFVAGQTATSTISLHPTGGFSGTVDLTATSAPGGISVSCVPSSISGTQTSTCTLGGSTPGSYTVTVTGTSGSVVHTTSIGVTVTAPSTPDFSMSANPASVSFVAGQTAPSTISLTSTGGFAGAVALTAASSPSGVAASCIPSSISGSQTSTCTLSGSTPGSYTVAATGTNGSLVHTTSISVTVTAPASPDFSITATPNTVSFVAGQSAFSTISLQSTGGFSGAVALTSASTPGGVTTSCMPASVSGTQTSACTMSGAALGSYTVVVTGTSATLSHTASIAVTIATTGPTARFTFTPPYPKVNNSVAFDASSSTDPDPSATLQARWDWQGDGVWDTPWSSTLTIEHVFTTAGAYVVKLEILDSHGLTAGIGQWVAVSNPGGGDKIPPQVSILSPPNATVIASANVTVTGVAWDNVAVSAIELSTDNKTWTPTSGTTSWSGTVLLTAGMNQIYARAIDTSGNVKTAVITVIADQSPGVSPESLADSTIPVLIGMSPVVALAAIHAFLWNQTRTPRKKVKK